jgi:hypothetical protein
VRVLLFYQLEYVYDYIGGKFQQKYESVPRIISYHYAKCEIQQKIMQDATEK